MTAYYIYMVNNFFEKINHCIFSSTTNEKLNMYIIAKNKAIINKCLAISL